MEPLKASSAIMALIVASVFGCSENGAAPKVELKCDWPSDYKVDTTIVDQLGKIRAIPFRPNEIKYVVDVYGLSKRITTGSLLPCNLPKSAEIDGKQVKISGHLLTFRNINQVDLFGNPFELTSIEVIDK
ncbi:hypothetical protein [Larkinella knui]|uniref:Lipoprotein n=1 Tax=Larkinella knui TaxID=2025310 RepID=A0A3P1CHT6_9BACT|nr:hypothetical protein [Larkinella knui]RRB12444.1 hypothetical protein EHT87_19795 [Larkinella knui]